MGNILVSIFVSKWASEYLTWSESFLYHCEKVSLYAGISVTKIGTLHAHVAENIWVPLYLVNHDDVTCLPTLLIIEFARFVYVNVYRELIDAECFDNAAEFLCQVLQPTCVQRSNFSTETYLPCKQFCDEFVSGCGSRFTERLKQALDCSKFPQYSRIGRNCHKQPSKYWHTMQLLAKKVAVIYIKNGNLISSGESCFFFWYICSRLLTPPLRTILEKKVYFLGGTG